MAAIFTIFPFLSPMAKFTQNYRLQALHENIKNLGVFGLFCWLIWLVLAQFWNFPIFDTIGRWGDQILGNMLSILEYFSTCCSLKYF